MESKETTQTGIDTEGADLLALAMKADSGEIDADEVPEGASPETPEKPPAGEPEKKPEGEGEPKPEEKKPELKDDPKPGEATKPEEESQYAKARKEQERRERSWQKLEEEKKAVREEREKLESERKELEGKKARAEVYRDPSGYSADDYEKFAESTDDPELSKKARERASALRKEEGETRSKASQEEFQKGWSENLKATIDANKDLEDGNSALGKELTRVLKEIPLFSLAPDGIRHAVEYAKANLQSGLVASLKEENQRLKEENERLNKLTSIGTESGPTQKPGVKSFEDMTLADQEADLRRRAEEADRAA